MKLLAIDIGNTTINFGLFSAAQLKEEKIFTEKFKKIPFGDYDAAIISSVVPDATGKIIRRLKIKPIILDHKNIPLKISLKKPAQVGADRLVNAVAAKTLYGYPAIVIDMGTATTIDVVSEKGEYAGGIIAPGIEMSAVSLYEKTAKLPKIKLPLGGGASRGNLIIGTNTKEAILAGIFTGHIGLLKEAIRRIKNQSRQGGTKIILTGGYVGYFSKYIDHSVADKDLTLKGLKIIFDKHRGKLC